MNMIDSHCHLHLMDLSPFDGSIQRVLDAAKVKGVSRFLCVSVTLDEYPQLVEIANQHEQVYISVGVHPNYKPKAPLSLTALSELASHPACIAIGETGLDFFRVEDEADKLRQQDQFRTHIQSAVHTGKPLIIHTRQAPSETIALLQEEGAERIGGVMHCFTESWEMALEAMALGFYISFSGIVTFKNAKDLQDVAKRMPLDRILIETDTPYLAPTPFRGQQNQPAYVYRVAEMLAELRGEPLEHMIKATTENFYQCFKLSPS